LEGKCGVVWQVEEAVKEHQVDLFVNSFHPDNKEKAVVSVMGNP
jgi:hypothetical protein